MSAQNENNGKQSQTDPGTVDRRRFLTAAAVGAGVIGTGALGVVMAKRGHKVVSQNGPPAPNADVNALFGPLARNGQLKDWTVENIYGVYLGAIPVILRHRGGKAFQVDVLKRDLGGPQGVGNTNSLSLFVANTGDGTQRTDENQGLGAMALASYLAKRDGSATRVGSLLTLTQRHQQHPNGSYSVL